MGAVDNNMIESPQFGDKYRLIWRKPVSKNVANVRNFTIDKARYRQIPVLLDDDLLKRSNMRFLASMWPNTGPKIYVSTAFLNLPLTIVEAGIWHEVGHIHYKHHLQDEYNDQEQLRSARISAIEKGNVILSEQQADRFAVMQAGKEAMIGLLKHLLLTRPTGGAIGWNDIGKQELQIRITAIRTFQEGKE